jgi:metal-responsive CopG/Arc/MetJ family transcriptional regulator
MQVTVRIPDEYGKKMDELGRKTGLKRSDIVRMAVKEFVDEKAASSEVSPSRKVSHLLGVAESGLRDLGQRHREYLIGKIRRTSR